MVMNVWPEFELPVNCQAEIVVRGFDPPPPPKCTLTRSRRASGSEASRKRLREKYINPLTKKSQCSTEDALPFSNRLAPRADSTSEPFPKDPMKKAQSSSSRGNLPSYSAGKPVLQKRPLENAKPSSSRVDSTGGSFPKKIPAERAQPSSRGAESHVKATREPFPRTNRLDKVRPSSSHAKSRADSMSEPFPKNPLNIVQPTSNYEISCFEFDSEEFLQFPKRKVPGLSTPNEAPTPSPFANARSRGPIFQSGKLIPIFIEPPPTEDQKYSESLKLHFDENNAPRRADQQDQHCKEPLYRPFLTTPVAEPPVDHWYHPFNNQNHDWYKNPNPMNYREWKWKGPQLSHPRPIGTWCLNIFGKPREQEWPAAGIVPWYIPFVNPSEGFMGDNEGFFVGSPREENEWGIIESDDRDNQNGTVDPVDEDHNGITKDSDGEDNDCTIVDTSDEGSNEDSGGDSVHSNESVYEEPPEDPAEDKVEQPSTIQKIAAFLELSLESVKALVRKIYIDIVRGTKACLGFSRQIFVYISEKFGLKRFWEFVTTNVGARAADSRDIESLSIKPHIIESGHIESPTVPENARLGHVQQWAQEHSVPQGRCHIFGPSPYQAEIEALKPDTQIDNNSHWLVDVKRSSNGIGTLITRQLSNGILETELVPYGGYV